MRLCRCPTMVLLSNHTCVFVTWEISNWPGEQAIRAERRCDGINNFGLVCGALDWRGNRDQTSTAVLHRRRTGANEMGRETVDFVRELNTQCGAGGLAFFGNVNVNAIPVNRCMESNRMKLFKASDFMMRGSELTLGDGKYFEVNSSNFKSFLFNFIFTSNFRLIFLLKIFSHYFAS